MGCGSSSAVGIGSGSRHELEPSTSFLPSQIPTIIVTPPSFAPRENHMLVNPSVRAAQEQAAAAAAAAAAAGGVDSPYSSPPVTPPPNGPPPPHLAWGSQKEEEILNEPIVGTPPQHAPTSAPAAPVPPLTIQTDPPGTSTARVAPSLLAVNRDGRAPVPESPSVKPRQGRIRHNRDASGEDAAFYSFPDSDPESQLDTNSPTRPDNEDALNDTPVDTPVAPDDADATTHARADEETAAVNARAEIAPLPGSTTNTFLPPPLLDADRGVASPPPPLVDPGDVEVRSPPT